MTIINSWVIPDIALGGASETSEAAALREAFQRRALAGMREVSVKILCHSFPLMECKAIEVRADGVVIPCLLDTLPARAFLQVEFAVGADGDIPHRLRFPVFIDSATREQTTLRFTFVDDGRTFLEKGLGSLPRSVAVAAAHREREFDGLVAAPFNR
ncbi:MAG: hypothetical protein ACFCUG_07015 [Thiotrichales bacterium]